MPFFSLPFSLLFFEYVLDGLPIEGIIASTGNFLCSINSTDFIVLSKYSIAILHPNPTNTPIIIAIIIFLEISGLIGFLGSSA